MQLLKEKIDFKNYDICQNDDDRSSRGGSHFYIFKKKTAKNILVILNVMQIIRPDFCHKVKSYQSSLMYHKNIAWYDLISNYNNQQSAYKPTLF